MLYCDGGLPVDVVVGKARATSIPLEVAPFLVGAPPGRALTGPLRDRFGLHRPHGISTIARNWSGCWRGRRASGHRSWESRPVRDRAADPAEHHASRTGCCGRSVTTQKSVGRGDRARYRQCGTRGLRRRRSGFDRLDRAVLTVLTRSFGGGPVGVDACRGGRRRSQHCRGGVRAIPVRAGMFCLDAARPGRHTSGVDSPGP